MSLQIFEINEDEWWAGEGSPEEMLRAYMNETGCTHEEATGHPDEMPRPLTEEELDGLQLGVGVDCRRLDRPVSFREHLAEMVAKGDAFPCLFAARDY